MTLPFCCQCVCVCVLGCLGVLEKVGRRQCGLRQKICFLCSLLDVSLYFCRSSPFITSSRKAKTKQYTKMLYACKNSQTSEAAKHMGALRTRTFINSSSSSFFLSFSFSHFYACGAINFPSINFHFLFSAVYPRIIFCSSAASHHLRLLLLLVRLAWLSFNLHFSG